MVCPKCGNKVGQEEAFCGHCGTPNTSQLPAPAMQHFSSPSSVQYNQHPGTPGIYPRMTPSQSGTPGQLPPQPQTSPLAGNSSIPSIAPRTANSTNQFWQYAPKQQGTFYHDATEAMNFLPGPPAQNDASRTQQGFPDSNPSANYPLRDPHSSQQLPLQNRQFNASGYLQPPFVTGQQYHHATRIQPPSLLKQTNGPLLLFVSICCAAIFLGAVVIGSLLLMKNSATHTHKAASRVIATVATKPPATPAPTVVAPTPTPLPTMLPTPPADAGFAWCGQSCVALNFATEYPATWQAGAVPNTNAIQFANPAQPDQYAIFKNQGPTASDAGTLVGNDLQAAYATQPGYTAPTATAPTTISGETWIKAVAYYQGASQQEEVTVLATVHGGKAYVIDLNAPTSQFATVSAQIFVNMLAKFQFLAT